MQATQTFPAKIKQKRNRWILGSLREHWRIQRAGLEDRQTWGRKLSAARTTVKSAHGVHRMRNSAASAILPGGPNGHRRPLSTPDRCHVPSLKLLEDRRDTPTTGISSVLCLCHILSRFKAEGYIPHPHLTPEKAHLLRNPPKMGGGGVASKAEQTKDGKCFLQVIVILFSNVYSYTYVCVLTYNNKCTLIFKVQLLFLKYFKAFPCITQKCKAHGVFKG